jgi:hypothetical protein
VLFHGTGYQFTRFAGFYSDKDQLILMKNSSNSEGIVDKANSKNWG